MYNACYGISSLFIEVSVECVRYGAIIQRLPHHSLLATRQSPEQRIEILDAS